MTPEQLAYDKYKNLKLAAADIGISWNTLYSRLKKQGVPVIGDKLRYGSDRDKLSAMAESEFKRIVPNAVAMNDIRWQYKYDFTVDGYKVDVKSSMPQKKLKRYENKSWAFSLKKQTLFCDFLCCFCFDVNRNISNILVIPKEFFIGLKTITVSCNGNSKWLDYSINEHDLSNFFISMNNDSDLLEINSK